MLWDTYKALIFCHQAQKTKSSQKSGMLRYKENDNQTGETTSSSNVENKLCFNQVPKNVTSLIIDAAAPEDTWAKKELPVSSFLSCSSSFF